MLNTTLHELLFIRICVYLLSYAPLFYIFLPPPLSILALLAELAYYYLILRPFEARFHLPADHPPDTRQEREALFERCIQNIPDPVAYLSLWALGAPIADIKRDNVRDFFLWAFFDCSDDGGSDKTIKASKFDEDELEGYLIKTEQLLGHPLPPGRSVHVAPLRLTLDAIPTRFRSVIWYLIVGLVDTATHLQLRYQKFRLFPTSLRINIQNVFPPRLLASAERWRRQSPSDQLSYWYRAPMIRDGKPGLPVVFLHGIGIGLYPYVDFLSELPSTSAVLAVEILPISMRLTKTNVLARPDFTRHLKEILREHEIDRFVLVGHSYGSVLATHVLHDLDLGEQVEGVVLVDPVSLLLHLPYVAYNFTRRLPTTANEWQLWYLASMDPGIASVLGRHFFWRENIIWKDELVNKRNTRRKAAVCLASRDLIVDTLSVARYLVYDECLTDLGKCDSLADNKILSETLTKGQPLMTASGVELLWFAGLDHAQVFDKRKNYGHILDTISRFCS